MNVKLLNVVLLAEDYQTLVNWYQETLSLDVINKEEGIYNYTELGINAQAIIGITPAKEVEHVADRPRNNSSLMQLQVSDIDALFKTVKEKNGKIMFGPTKDEKYNFQYGGIADIEGNQIWIVEASKQLLE